MEDKTVVTRVYIIHDSKKFQTYSNSFQVWEKMSIPLFTRNVTQSLKTVKGFQIQKKIIKF